MDLWKKAEQLSDAAGNVKEGKSHDEERLKLVNEGIELTDKCLAMKDLDRESTAHCHKWRAVLGSKWGDMQPTAEKIKNSYSVRDHAKAACDVLENDSVANHVLGAFYYHVSTLSWIERKVAGAIFHQVPDHKLPESLPYLHRAQTAEPTFIRNALMLGDTYAQLSKSDEAKKWYSHCSKQTPTSLIEETLIEKCKSKA